MPKPTPDAAVATALAYLDALRWDVLIDDRRRRQVIDRYATELAAPRLDAALVAPAEALRTVAKRPVVARTSVLGYRVEHIDSRSAAIAVWGLALFGSTAYRPTTQWSTSRVRLEWRGDRWLIAGLRSQGGPAPDFPLRELVRADRRYREPAYVP